MMIFTSGGGIAGLGSNYAVSTDQSYTANTTVSYTFSFTPVIFGAYMRCTVADNGFSVGDIINLGTESVFDGTNSFATTVYRTGATVKHANRGAIWGSSPTAGWAAFTPGRWAIVFWAIG